MSQPSRRDWVIAQGYTTLRHSPFIGPTSHPVPRNSWRQLPAFISAPSSEQKPTFRPDHLDSFLPLQLRSRRRRPCHTFVSRLTKILVPDLPSRYVRQDRCPSAKAGKCSAGQFLEGTVASCPITTPKSSVRVRTFPKLQPPTVYMRRLPYHQKIVVLPSPPNGSRNNN